jgi:hypothetical protein
MADTLAGNGGDDVTLRDVIEQIHSLEHRLMGHIEFNMFILEKKMDRRMNGLLRTLERIDKN